MSADNQVGPLGHGFVALGFAGGSVLKNLPANAGDSGSIPGSERSRGEGNDYPFQFSFLQNSMDRGAWQATVHRVSKSRTRLGDFHFTDFLPTHTCRGLLYASAVLP